MNSMQKQRKLTNKIIQMFDLVLKDSQDMWIINYCDSKENERQRILEDEEFRSDFLSLLEELVKMTK